MSFDGVLLHKLIDELQIVKTGRITKINESGDTDFIFTIRANHQNYNLMICLSSLYARIHFTTKHYDTQSSPKSLTMFLRKHIEGYFIDDIYQHQNDRIIIFKLTGYNELRDYQVKYLICEIMGRYSNLILTDNNYKILEVLKKEGVSEFGRTMLISAKYDFPVSDKLNPFIDTTNLPIASPKELCNTFNGISLLLATYTFKNDDVLNNLKAVILGPTHPAIIKGLDGKLDFYFNPLDYEIIQEFKTISELLDNYYFEADLQAKIKLKTNDLANFIQKQIKKNEKKLKKLEQDLIAAQNCDDLKLKGELLLSYPNLKSKEAKVEVLNYYTNEKMVIELDNRYDVITNSQRYYKKYQKTKAAIFYIAQQSQIAKDEINYFNILLSQLNNCNINDALEIQQELIDNKYLLKQNKSNNKKIKPHFLTYIVDDVLISVGKNNIQNEYITHKLAKASDYWFHVKDASGSHVVIHSDLLSEELIRTAAMLAAYYSDYKDSSSVAVDYTQIKYIKKIPGKRACFVTYSKQKTIYIDPDKSLIESLRIKK